MPLLLLILFIGVLAYFIWRHNATTLTRNCRWREDRARGVWRCAFCGAETQSRDAPRDCLRDRR
ncbi:hypothetical protein [Jhaorihella thermophila]|uniref:hypothetical protein n=1 Tax=Jhaorihella thermophila TaxID=488547 RepID=UPI000CDE7354|nr:hypothetical protein [Jhaorihella thermophila]